MIDTYRVKRRCLVADNWREYGELVPEAHTWRLVESEVSAGVIEPTRVSGQEFSDAIERFCPELADELYALFGVESATPPDDDDADDDDGNGDASAGDAAAEPAKAKRPRKAPVLVKPPEALEG